MLLTIQSEGHPMALSLPIPERRMCEHLKMWISTESAYLRVCIDMRTEAGDFVHIEYKPSDRKISQITNVMGPIGDSQFVETNEEQTRKILEILGDNHA